MEREDAEAAQLRGLSSENNAELSQLLVTLSKRANVHDNEHVAETLTASVSATGAAELRFRVPAGRPLRDVGVSAQALPGIGIAALEAMGAIRARGLDPGPVDSDMIWVASSGTVVLHQLALAGQVRKVEEAMSGPTQKPLARRLSPEVASDQPTDERTDVFHVAWLLFELRTGFEPFPRTDEAAFLSALGRSGFGDPKELGVKPGLAHLLRLGLSAKSAIRPSPRAFIAGLRGLKLDAI